MKKLTFCPKILIKSILLNKYVFEKIHFRYISLFLKKIHFCIQNKCIFKFKKRLKRFHLKKTFFAALYFSTNFGYFSHSDASHTILLSLRTQERLRV